MKAVNNQADLTKELKKLKKGEEILFYDRPLNTYKDKIEFENYLSRLMIVMRRDKIEITGALSFKLKEIKNGNKFCGIEK